MDGPKGRASTDMRSGAEGTIASGAPTTVRFPFVTPAPVCSDPTFSFTSVGQVTLNHSFSFLLWETTRSELIYCVYYGLIPKQSECTLSFPNCTE